MAGPVIAWYVVMSSSSRRPRGASPSKSDASSRHDSPARRQSASRGKPATSNAAPVKVMPARKGELHPRNPHRGRYDMSALTRVSPELAAFLITTPGGNASIDFSDPMAVKALNRALLRHHYGVSDWGIPAGYLCPPIPGRADYLHYLADLLVEANGRGQLPPGERVRALDVGVGANVIYPLLANRSFGWQMVGSDISATALESAHRNVMANVVLRGQIELRLQRDRRALFAGLWGQAERFDLVLCNPPFHASEADMAREAQRKWRGLDKSRQQRGNASRKGRTRQERAGDDRSRVDRSRRHSAQSAPALNFAGQAAELWCPGGEEAFVTRMVSESRDVASRCLWFSSLVAHASSLPGIKQALAASGASEVRVIEMSQGQKISRCVVWSFLTPAERRQWGRDHWQKHD